MTPDSERDRTKRRNRGELLLPPLAIIVIVLLCLLGLVAIFGPDREGRSPSGVDIPLDRPEGMETPNPQPPAPVIPRPS